MQKINDSECVCTHLACLNAIFEYRSINRVKQCVHEYAKIYSYIGRVRDNERKKIVLHPFLSLAKWKKVHSSLR